jgi:putative MATE family efflux protein
MPRDDLTRRILSLSWPIIVTQLLNMFYNLTDAFWIGNLEGKASVAAIQVSGPVFGVIVSIGFGFSSAAVALISQYTGARLDEKAGYTASQVIGVMLILSVLLSFTGILLTPFMISLLGVEEAVAKGAIDYIRIIFLGMPLIFLTMSCDGIFRGRSRMVLSMSIMSVSVVINIILDPLFISGYSILPAMGISGAAIATVISYLFPAVVSLLILRSGRVGIGIKREEMRPDMAQTKRIVRIGLPAMIGHGGSSIGFFILMYVVALVPNSTVALAGYGIGDRLMSMITMFSTGIGAAGTTLTGEALGREDIKGAEKTVRRALELAFSISCALALLAFAFRSQFVGLFINDNTVIDEGSSFIALFAFGMPFFAIFSIANGAFAGSGHNVPAMTTELARLIAVRVPLSYVLGISLGMGSRGIWLGMSISNVVAAVMGMILLGTDGWKKKVIEHAGAVDEVYEEALERSPP